jgi:MFS family permease
MRSAGDLRLNYWAHSVEGALFMGGLSFVNPHTVLPRMFQALEAPSFLIALAPSLLMIGFILPGLLVARHIETLPTLRPFVVRVGTWQRLPYLLSALGLIFWPDSGLGLALVAFAPLSSGLFGGVGVNAWKEYVASTIPERQRSSLWGIRFSIGALIGLAGGEVVRRVLDAHPGAYGYGLLHLGAALLLIASMLVFLLTHEGERTPRRPAAGGVREALRELPALLRADASVRTYALSRVAFHGLFVLVPFLGLRALEVLGKPDSYLGELVVANTLGSLAGFFVGGYSGDRHGGKVSMVGAHAGLLALVAWAPFAGSDAAFLGVFALFGFALSLATVGSATLDLDIAPMERRPTYQAMLGLFALAGLLLSSLISTLLQVTNAPFYVAATLTGASLTGSLYLLLSLAEPRRSTLAPAPSAPNG